MLTVYKSSAGAGKTYTLAKRYIDLLYSTYGSRKHRRILAVTFTKKATAEMKERIIKELNLLAQAEPSNYSADLMQDHHLNDEQLQTQAQVILYDLLQDYSHFQVTTIDSFFQQIIRSFARELNLPGAYNLELDSRQILENAVDNFFYNLPKDEQNHHIQNILRIIQDKMTDGKDWNPRRDIMTLSNEIFDEVYQQQEEALNSFLDEPDNLKQYRSMLYAIQTDYWKRYRDIEQRLNHLIEGVNLKDINNGVNTLSPFHWKEAELSRYLKCELKPSRFMRCTTDQIDEVLKKPSVQYLRHDLQSLAIELNELLQGETCRRYVTARAISRYLSYLEIVHAVSECINAANKELNRLPIAQTNRLLSDVISQNEESPFIYDKMGTRLNNFMIDEFQDTSRMQWRNFRPLITETSARGQENLLVGDVKQCIYRWRNSDMHLMQTEIFKDFADIQSKNLPSNYRSDYGIVNTNNDIFSRLATVAEEAYRDSLNGLALSFPVEISTIYQDVMQTPTKTEEEGYARFEKIEKDDAEMFERIDAIIDGLQERHISLGKVAFLFLYNKDIPPVAQHLLGRGINVVSGEGMLLVANSVVNLIISLLHLQLDKKNRIEQTQAHYFYLLHQGADADEALWRSVSDTFPKQLALDDMNGLPLTEQVSTIIRKLQLDSKQSDIPYLQTLTDKVYEYCERYNADLFSFLSYWDEQGSKIALPMQETDAESVQLLTIHKSKGLEYDVVILPKFNPSPTGSTSKPHILWNRPQVSPFDAIPVVPVLYGKELSHSYFAESYWQELQDRYLDYLNLSYVAFTRAKRELYVLYSDNKLLHQVLGDDIVERGTKPIDAVVKAEKAEQLSFTEFYPKVKGEVKIHLASRDFFAEPSTEVNLKKRVNLGTVMHNLLCLIHHKDDEHLAIQQFLRQGIITRQQLPIIQTEMQRFWQLTANRDWFSEQWRVLNEQDIALPNGLVRRPDRLIIKGDRAVVIDYKFGYGTPRKYETQVQEYMTYMQQMGYQVTGYLCYVNRNEIQQVKL